MKTLNDIRLFSFTEIKIMCNVINYYGSGQHPFADKDTLTGFSMSYTKACLNKLVKVIDSSNPDKRIAENLIARMS